MIVHGPLIYFDCVASPLPSLCVQLDVKYPAYNHLIRFVRDKTVSAVNMWTRLFLVGGFRKLLSHT